MIIGFDISTKCIGFCILDNDGQLQDVDYIWLEKIDYPDKIKKIKNVLNSKFNFSTNENVYIYVEEALRRSNNQNVVNILQRWNGMVCALLYEWFNIFPETITEVTARKINNIVIPKNIKGIDKKRYVLETLLERKKFPKEKIKYKITKNYQDFCYDMADAIVVAQAGVEKCNEQKK